MNEFEQLALDTAAKSPCEKRKVGAVVCSEQGVYYARCNHNPTNDPCELTDGSTNPDVVHAEVAVMRELEKHIESQSPTYATDWTLYVTHNPCDNCISFINDMSHKYNIRVSIKVVEQFMKFDTDKLRYDLIPPSAMEGLAEVLTYGAKKYKPNNWKSGDIDRYIAALYRHLEAWRKGEKKDEESGMKHLAHALTNVAFLLELDDED